MEGLPKSMGFEVILVVVDRLTKYVHFVPVSYPNNAAKIASLYILHIFKLHDVGGEKVSFLTNEIYVGLGGLNQNSMMGLMCSPKAIGEGPRNSLYFMPWT